MQYRVTGTVPAPDGKGEMTRVEVNLPEGQVIWLTRDTNSIRVKLEKFRERLLDTSGTRAGVLDELPENDQTESS